MKMQDDEPAPVVQEAPEVPDVCDQCNEPVYAKNRVEIDGNVFCRKCKPRPAPKPRADAPIHDIEAILAIVSSIYHFDDGVRKHGTVYPQWNRVSTWLATLPKKE